MMSTTSKNEWSSSENKSTSIKVHGVSGNSLANTGSFAFLLEFSWHVSQVFISVSISIYAGPVHTISGLQLCPINSKMTFMYFIQ